MDGKAVGWFARPERVCSHKQAGNSPLGSRQGGESQPVASMGAWMREDHSGLSGLKHKVSLLGRLQKTNLRVARKQRVSGHKGGAGGWRSRMSILKRPCEGGRQAPWDCGTTNGQSIQSTWLGRTPPDILHPCHPPSVPQPGTQGSPFSCSVLLRPSARNAYPHAQFKAEMLKGAPPIISEQIVKHRFGTERQQIDNWYNICHKNNKK